MLNTSNQHSNRLTTLRLVTAEPNNGIITHIVSCHICTVVGCVFTSTAGFIVVIELYATLCGHVVDPKCGCCQDGWVEVDVELVWS